jgi:hypothetical protein
VRRQWNDYRSAIYRFAQVEKLCWDYVSGGINAQSPQPFVHGYVWCNQKISGDLAHACIHGPPPHRIKVCLVKKDNENIWNEILSIAGPRPINTSQIARNAVKRRFKERGFSPATVTALLAAGIDAPERLLFLNLTETPLKGIGPKKLVEINRYRGQYLPSTVER